MATPPAPYMNAQVLANGAGGGHPRTVPYSKMSSKGCVELQISQSRPKIDKEVGGDARFYIAPQKTGENVKQKLFCSKKFCEQHNFGVEK